MLKNDLESEKIENVITYTLNKYLPFSSEDVAVLKIGLPGQLVFQLLANKRIGWTRITLFDEILVARA